MTVNDTVTTVEDDLEAELLVLGGKERVLEDRVRRLRERSRAAGRAGQFDEADKAWDLVLELKKELDAVQDGIQIVERKLYGLRRHRRR